MTRRRLFAAGGAALLLGLAIASPAYSQDKPEAVAQKTAEFWLALVDAGRYAESWEAASTSFKAAVGVVKWQDTAKRVRAPLGKVLSRKLDSAQFVKNPPQAAPGDYVFLTYDTSFQKKAVTEIIVPILDKDGHWRVSTYTIKAAP